MAAGRRRCPHPRLRRTRQPLEHSWTLLVRHPRQDRIEVAGWSRGHIGDEAAALGDQLKQDLTTAVGVGHPSNPSPFDQPVSGSGKGWGVHTRTPGQRSRAHRAMGRPQGRDLRLCQRDLSNAVDIRPGYDDEAGPGRSAPLDCQRGIAPTHTAVAGRRRSWRGRVARGRWLDSRLQHTNLPVLPCKYCRTTPL